ncbi:PulJ/GspJ family protein [Ramlibacter rhizophilus]|uniref:Prepilin-type N-terminal cleavage/methylation domain-containing protein n=1 Tax=Ramlibacter rhizophilus TaxID=1781167 RepID=A0A4Z0BDG4_9BURK|nr:prepilin-type N-terminal cleavage/methylation domain-containing protein [Ramlibacter rhizophilus]TFY97312.1 prepilin-type N-terminal cleavage/methylation domain-containing protein [Ramlibacter rhizophilus]
MTPSRSTGFTLVELLVALFVLSLVAILSWRGLDGMVRTQAQTQERADEVLAAQVGLAQWKTDLDALVQLPQLTALDWDGRVFRLTRRNPADPGDGVRVTAWTQRNVNGRGTWLRWQSPPLRTRGEVQEAWARAGAWAENAGDADRAREVPVLPLSEWQLYYHRGGAWTNPQSRDAARVDPATAAAAAAQPGARAQPPLPDGIRLVLVLPPGHPLAGQVSVDWASPGQGGGRSS